MKAHSFYTELIIIYLISFIPWPDLKEAKLYCSRDSTRLVRKLVNLKFKPILDKYKVQFPLECPFHPQRDIFRPQEKAKKRNRPSQWTCRLCGKSFFEEHNIDKHFGNRHKNHINTAEDAVCLADLCDVMRCDVFATQESSIAQAGGHITDLELWSAPKAFVLNQIYHISGRNEDAKKQVSSFTYGEDNTKKAFTEENLSTKSQEKNDCRIRKSKTKKQIANLPCTESSVTRDFLLIEKEKEKCRPNRLIKIKYKCETLIRTCIMGLLLKMPDYAYKELEDELNKAVCWYLSCDRYWEDSPAESRAFPWILLLVFIVTMSLGICLCYYVIWILFERGHQVYSTNHSFESEQIYL